MDRPYFAILLKRELMNENGETATQTTFVGDFNTYEKALENFNHYKEIFHHSNTKLSNKVQADPTGEMCIARISPMTDWISVKDI